MALNGSGTQADPYLIGSAEDLVEMSQTVSGTSHYATQTAHINFSGAIITTPLKLGNFSANGFSISNVGISVSSGAGIQGALYENGTISDVTVSGGGFSSVSKVIGSKMGGFTKKNATSGGAIITAGTVTNSAFDITCSKSDGYQNVCSTSMVATYSNFIFRKAVIRNTSTAPSIRGTSCAFVLDDCEYYQSRIYTSVAKGYVAFHGCSGTATEISGASNGYFCVEGGSLNLTPAGSGTLITVLTPAQLRSKEYLLDYGFLP